MKPTNVLFIMADEHNRAMLGCSGHPIVQTPNLDGLAKSGIRFTNAYTNCPICVPARASLATGRYNHDNHYWDNATAYDGRVTSWGHRLQEAGILVESIGKLHYRKDDDPTGFDKRQVPMYIKDGVGSITAAIRDPMPPFDPESKKKPGFAAKACAGESDYTKYDLRVAELASQWLGNVGKYHNTKPWCLFVSFLSPHYPLTVPEPYYSMYRPDDMPGPKLDPEEGYRRHPWVEILAQRQPHANCLTLEKSKAAMAAYLGLCSFVDNQIGLVLKSLEAAGLSENTRIIFTSDHGENAGARGLWGKSVFYEESTGIPMLISGPDISAGSVCDTPVSLVDIYPTIIKSTGVQEKPDDNNLPGCSLIDVAVQTKNKNRVIFSQYHASASPTGGFMIRKGKFKFNYYVDYQPELFDLDVDPDEEKNLAQDPKYDEICSEYEKLLREIVDPEVADRQAKDDQNAMIDFHGGREKILREKMGVQSYTPAPAI